MRGNLESKLPAHETEPLKLQGGQVGLEKHANPLLHQENSEKYLYVPSQIERKLVILLNQSCYYVLTLVQLTMENRLRHARDPVHDTSSPLHL